MSYTADTPASVDLGGFTVEQWNTAIADPHWFAAVIAPGLVGTLTAIASGLAHPDMSAMDELAHARRALDDRAAVLLDAGLTS